ncbi:MAG: hypothetical protein ACLU3R_04050 [Acutalibacteraceae bacterium]
MAATNSVTELFCDKGISVNPKVNKDLYSGINVVKEYLSGVSGKRLYIFKSCVNLIRELKSYRWGENDVPVKRDDHCLDELRYYLMSRPESNTPALPKSEIEVDKERLIRRLNRK